MKNIKKIALLMIAMMLCVFISSGIVNATKGGLLSNQFTQVEIDGGGSSDPSEDNKSEETHEADTTIWKYSGNKHWNPCKVSGCTEHTYNESSHNGSATCYSKAWCNKCQIYWGSKAEHQVGSDTSWYQLDNKYHYQKCKWYDCNN